MPLITIPRTIEGMNKSERYILNKLKQLYMLEPSISYLYLEPKIKNLTPDFILIDPMRGVMIIEVKAWSLDYFETINQKNVTTTTNQTLENPSYKARRYFNTLQKIFYHSTGLLDGNNLLKFKLHSIVTFTELREDESIESGIDTFLDHYPARVLYKDELRKLELDELFDSEIEAIDLSLIDTIRASIFPEITIIKNQKSLEENILALDIEQERFAKSLPLGHYMITGIPGSGKTVALVSRAIYLAKLFPSGNILILTYNKSLRHQLKERINLIKKELMGVDISIDNIEVATFHQKAMSLSSLSPQNYKKDPEEFWRDILPNDAINYAKPIYDAILIDEYQDFYKNWFELVLKMLKEYKEDNKIFKNLFLAGDRLQSLYNPNELIWKKDIGLDMRGRSKLLKTSYRVTKEHIELGLSILSNDKRYKDEVSKFYEEGKDILLKNSTTNSIEILQSDDFGIVQRVQKLFEQYSYSDILLLAPTWKRVNSIKRALPIELQYNIVSSKDIVPNKANFTTYHSAKGIESKVAIVIDIDKIKDRKLIYVASTRAYSKLILHAVDFKTTRIGEEIIGYEAFEELL
ncbi:MAG: AAA family ATPase [Epsilonproteobacteria bacterium]|nr:AAA family ATPase [Campylobacterota bacterium]